MATLTPDIAYNLMQQSMSGGVSNALLDQYGGYDAVRDAYTQAGGGFERYDTAPTSYNFTAPTTAPIAAPTTAPIVAPVTTSAPTGTQDYSNLVTQAYQELFGRAPEQEGFDYWTQKAENRDLNYEDLARKIAKAAQGTDRIGAQEYLGKEIWAPTEYLRGTSGMGYQDIIDYVNQNINDPVKISQAAAKYGVDPNEIYQAFTSRGESPYSLQQIQEYLGKGQTGFEPRLQEILTSSLESPDFLSQFEQNRANIERTLGLESGALASDLTSKSLGSKSIEDIEKLIQDSGANRYQEAMRVANMARNAYGLDANEAKDLVANLLKGKETDETANSVYKELLSKGMSGDLQDRILSDAAVRTPDSPFFQANPQLLAAYKPLDIKAAPGAPGQYGYSNNAPILSAKEADKLLGGEVIKGGNNYFGYGGEGKKDDALGWDLRSKYAGSIANGAGIFGVNATNKEISDFDKIEKEIERLGGIKTEQDAEGNVRQVVYKDVMDPESGRMIRQAVDARSLFSTGNDEYSDGGYEKFKTYEKTKDALAKGAQQLNIDPSQFSSVKGLFDAVNDKADKFYVVTGRANKWDPAAAEAQGITGVGRDRGGINHAQVLYQKVGNQLMPVQTLKTFNFDDPNTTSGFFGDIAQGIGSIMSIPPIQLAFAMAGGWPALFEGTLGTDLAVNAASKLAGSIGTNLGLEGAASKLVGNALLNAGTSALNTGLMTGDLGKAGIAGLAGGIGSGISNGLPMLLKDVQISPAALKLGSEIAGGAAATSITGQDPGAYAINRLLSTGIGALTTMGAKEAGMPTSGPGLNLLKAMLPIITSKQVTPEDVTRLAAAVNAYQKA